MSESLIVKIVATGMLVATLSLIGALLNRLIANVPTTVIRKCALVFACAAAASLLLVIGLNPAKSTSSGVKAFGNLVAFATIGFFGLFLVAGFTLKMRK